MSKTIDPHAVYCVFEDSYTIYPLLKFQLDVSLLFNTLLIIPSKVNYYQWSLLIIVNVTTIIIWFLCKTGFSALYSSFLKWTQIFLIIFHILVMRTLLLMLTLKYVDRQSWVFQLVHILTFYLTFHYLFCLGFSLLKWNYYI